MITYDIKVSDKHINNCHIVPNDGYYMICVDLEVVTKVVMKVDKNAIVLVLDKYNCNVRDDEFVKGRYTIGELSIDEK